MTVKAYTIGTASMTMRKAVFVNYDFDYLMICPNCSMILPANDSMKFCHWCGTHLELDEIKEFVKERWLDEDDG